MPTPSKGVRGGPPLMPRVVAAISKIGRDFRTSEIADLVGDPRRDSVKSMIGVLAERGLCHVIAYEDLATGGTCGVYRPGPPPENYVRPVFVRRGGSSPIDRAPSQSDLERAEKQWRARARGAARFDVGCSTIEAAQIRELKAWRAS